MKFVLVNFLCFINLFRNVFTEEFSLFRGNITANLIELPKILAYPFRPQYSARKLSIEYDYVIVGSGPAGSVLANRLSEDPRVTVLLLELGDPELPLVTDPPFADVFLQGTDFNFNYVTEEQSRACQGCVGRRCPFPHGRGVGGSSIINYMIYTRGNRRDYDMWRAAGNPGWGYEDVLPYFIKSEDANIRDFDQNGFHGHGGYLSVEDCPFRSKIADAYIAGAQQIGYPYHDYNADEQIGVSYMQATTKNGVRVTSARAFLDPVKHRKNLHIQHNSRVTKVVISEDSQAVKGVQFLHNKKYKYVQARREVILSAGAFESAKLLMLSGIGPLDHLQEMGIKVVKDLPVGKTMYEHLGTLGPIITFDKQFDNLVSWETGVTLNTILEYLNGRGFITSNGVEALVYTRTNFSAYEDPGYPDIEIMQVFTNIAFDTSRAYQQSFRLTDEVFRTVFLPLRNRRAMHFLPMLLHPRSKGFLKLKSTNPFHHPILEPNYFADDRDIEALVAGIRVAIDIAATPAFAKLGARLHEAKVPGCPYVFNTHEYWRCYVQVIAATFHHQVATCKMGPEFDPTTVVDHRLRVHGFHNLRVADIGIIPMPPSGHTVAHSYMIGEKAADMIKEDWQEHNYNYYDESFAEIPFHRFSRSIGKRTNKEIFDWQKSDEDEKSSEEVTTELPHVAEKNFPAHLESEYKARVVEEPLVPPPREEVHDIRDLLRADVDEIKISKHHYHKGHDHKHASNSSTAIPSFIPTETPTETATELTTASVQIGDNIHPPELLSENLPSVSEDGIRMVTLANDTKYGKGDAKPRLITLKLAEMETQEYNAEDFKNIAELENSKGNSTQFENVTSIVENMEFSVTTNTSTVSMKIPKELELALNRPKRYMLNLKIDTLIDIGQRLGEHWNSLNEGSMHLKEAYRSLKTSSMVAPTKRRKRSIDGGSKIESNKYVKALWGRIKLDLIIISELIEKVLLENVNDSETKEIIQEVNSTWLKIKKDSEGIELMLSSIIDCNHCRYDRKKLEFITTRLNDVITNMMVINIYFLQIKDLEDTFTPPENNRVKRKLDNPAIDNILSTTNLLGTIWKYYNNSTSAIKDIILNITKFKLQSS